MSTQTTTGAGRLVPVDATLVAVAAAAPLAMWAGSALGAPMVAVYLAVASASTIALLVMQVRVGLRFQDGAGISSVVLTIAGVAAWAVGIVLVLDLSLIAVPATSGAVVLFVRALREVAPHQPGHDLRRDARLEPVAVPADVTATQVVS